MATSLKLRILLALLIIPNNVQNLNECKMKIKIALTIRDKSTGIRKV